MSRRKLGFGVASVVVLAVLAVGTANGASNAIKQCPEIKSSPWQFPGTQVKGTTYGSYVVGGFTCAAAVTWIKKLTPTLLKNRKFGASNVLTNGPRGYLCTANPDAKGHAFAGSCRKGKLAATVGFGWGGRPAPA